VADELTGEAESLDGLIEVDADVVSGDSGGPLLDADGEVVGMTTAASSGSATVVGYAIPIEDALAIVQKIRNGDESGGVTLGYPAFLGVALSSTTSTPSTSSGYGSSTRPGSSSPLRGTTTSGATIAGVYDGTPAASAGLAAGDTITAVDGTAVSSGTALSTLLGAHDPGDSVTLTWTDTAGTSRSASVTLAQGPAA
jgi:S1-C subfamily serine protease